MHSLVCLKHSEHFLIFKVFTLSDRPKRELLGMSKITYKFQVTIPKRVREKFNFNEGDMLVFIEENGKLILMKSTEY